MKTHELPCIISNGLSRVPRPVPRFPSDACDLPGPADSLVLNLPVSDGAPADAADNTRTQSLNSTTSFLSVCMKSTHTHAHEKTNMRNLNLFRSIIDNLMFSMSAFIWDGLFSRKQRAGRGLVPFTPWWAGVAAPAGPALVHWEPTRRRSCRCLRMSPTLKSSRHPRDPPVPM